MSGKGAPSRPAGDPLDRLDTARRATLSAIADHLIPAAHGMPSAGAVAGDTRLRFVLDARPDLVEPLRAALRPDLPSRPAERLAALERDQPDLLAALQLVIVGAYYTDRDVRARLGYPGQQALQLQSWKYPVYLEEGLVDRVLARGAIWRDPSTGRTAVEPGPTAATPAERGT